MKHKIFTFLSFCTIFSMAQAMQVQMSAEKTADMLAAVRVRWQGHERRIKQLMYEANSIAAQGNDFRYIDEKDHIANFNSTRKTVTTFIPNSMPNSRIAITLGYNQFLSLFEEVSLGEIREPDREVTFPIADAQKLQEHGVFQEFLMLLRYFDPMPDQQTLSALVNLLVNKDSKACVTCGTQNCTLCCGRCQASYYCSQECQRKNWKEHKNFCKELAKASQQKK